MASNPTLDALVFLVRRGRGRPRHMDNYFTFNVLNICSNVGLSEDESLSGEINTR